MQFIAPDLIDATHTDKDSEMDADESKLTPHQITSRLIDLIIRLPEEEQVELLQKLECRKKSKIKSKISNQNNFHNKTPRYASGDYIFWDLFG